MPKRSAPARDFGLCKFVFKRVNGEGEPIECPRTPSALVGGLEKFSGGIKGPGDELRQAFWIGYLSLKAQDMLGDLGMEFPDNASDEERCDWLMDHYSQAIYALDDDGNVIDDEDSEPDPTSTN